MFRDWINQKYKNKQVTIFDIGCGNCNVINYLPDNSKYIGIDINETLVNHSNNMFKSKKDNFKVYLQDIEEELNQEVEQMMDISQVCYIDSVLTLLEDPKRVLQEILIPKFDFIFLGRIPLYQETIKTVDTWPGMSGQSPLWRFSQDFFISIFKEAVDSSSFRFKTLVLGTPDEQENGYTRIVIQIEHPKKIHELSLLGSN